MREKNLAALIVVDPVNVRYLTGFSGDDSVLLLAPRRKLLVTDSRYTEQARQECAGLPLFVRTGPMSDAVAAVLDKAGLTTAPLRGRKNQPPMIGIEAEAVTVNQHRAYRKRIGRGLKPLGDMVAALRLVKDDYEISQLRRAARIAESAMQQLLGWLKVGVTEQQLAARLDYEMMCIGAAGPSFQTIAAIGPHAAQPHAVPGRTRLRKGQSLLFDWGAQHNGYRSDLTRCFVAGRIRPDFAEAYARVLDAQAAAIQAIKPGVSLKAVDQAARAAIGDSMPMYGHGTGHGIGLKIHEGPALSANSKGQLAEGMVVTVEPGVYVPGRFGIRIEDDVVVTARGAKLLSRLAKDSDSLTLQV